LILKEFIRWEEMSYFYDSAKVEFHGVEWQDYA